MSEQEVDLGLDYLVVADNGNAIRQVQGQLDSIESKSQCIPCKLVRHCGGIKQKRFLGGLSRTRSLSDFVRGQEDRSKD